MKKGLLLTMALLLALNVCLVPTVQAEEPDFLEVFSGSSGGSWYTVGSEIAALIQDNVEGVMARVAPGGGSANPTTVQKKEGMLGLAYTGVAYEAYTGAGDYAEAHGDICHVISLYSMPFLWVALRENEEINTIYDLANKRISPGRTAQTGLAIARASLAAHGIDMNQVTANGGTVSLLGDSERLNMLRDRNLDAASGLLPLDHSELQSMSLNPGIKLITLDPEKIPALQAAIPGLEAITIEAKTFDEYQTEPVCTVAAVTNLICHKDLSEDLVYRITKAIYEHSQSLDKYYNANDSVIRSNPLAGVDENFPVHPGAMKFYKEIGIVAQ